MIVIVISRFLQSYSKAKCTRALAYSRALRRIKGGFPMGGDQEKLRSEGSGGDRVAVKVGVVDCPRDCDCPQS